MLGELITELRGVTVERLRSPLLGAFVAGWLVANWKAVAVLMFSQLAIEDRIEFIDQHYLSLWHVLYAPMLFAVLFTALSPWVNFGVQVLQEFAISRRRMHKLGSDTRYLVASVERAHAQAQVNRILAKDQVTQQQQQEITTLQKQLEDQARTAQSRIDAREAELEQLRQEYTKVSTEDTETAKRQREEMDRLMVVLQEQRQQALVEQEALKELLVARQKELERRLDAASRDRAAVSDIDLRRIIVGRRFRLYHNPKIGPERSKTITFDPNGTLGIGANSNEHAWRIKHGKLEIVQADGRVHSRFNYLPDSDLFVHTGEKDTKSARGQYIVPEVA